LWLLQSITVQETDQQMKLDNPPSRLAVDGREKKPLHQVKRRVEVTFGNTLDRLMIKTIERSLSNFIRSTLPAKDVRGLDRVSSNWQWLYIRERGATPIIGNPLNQKSLQIGSMLILRPRPHMKYAGMQNLMAAKIDVGKRPFTIAQLETPGPGGRDYREKRPPNSGEGRSGGHGFMRKAIETLKRNRLLKDYTIYSTHTLEYENINEVYMHGTPCIIVRARRRNKGYKRNL
jgi:hypothetical protein